MRIFLSYASQDREIARAIERDLTEQGHDVFFDRDDLPPGEEYHARIRRAIQASHLLIFLISPEAVDAGSYTLTEIDIAGHAWKRASGRILPVLLRPTPPESLPHLVRSVTWLEPEGNLPASVAAAVHRIARARTRARLVPAAGALALLLVVLAAWGLWRRDEPQETAAAEDVTMAIVPAGVFTMGDDIESPLREVYVDSFRIDRLEVTTADYARFLDATGALNPPDGWETLTLATGGNLPVMGVDWHDAEAYCEWAGKRLPTESEWEKAARGTDGRTYPWGDGAPTLEYANFENFSPEAYHGGLKPVGSHTAGDSPYGVSDLAGNVSEWVADWYSESFPISERRNPTGPDSGDGRVIRGGDRFDSGERMSAVKRYFASPDTRADNIGFRCAQDI